MGTTNHPTAVEANQCVSLCSKRQMYECALVHQVCQCRGAFDRTVVLVAIGEDDKATDAVAKSANAADAVFEVVGHIPAATLANWGMTEGEVRLVLPGEPISG
jgi:hypothetical protein